MAAYEGQAGQAGQDMRKGRARGQRVSTNREASILLGPVLRTPYIKCEGILSPARLLRQFPIRHCAIAPAYRSARDEGANIPDQARSVALGVDFASFPLDWFRVPVLVGEHPWTSQTILNRNVFGQAITSRVGMNLYFSVG